MPSRVRFSDWLHHVETKRFITVGRLDTAVAWLATDSVPLHCLIRTTNTSYGAGQVYIRFNAPSECDQRSRTGSSLLKTPKEVVHHPMRCSHRAHRTPHACRHGRVVLVPRCIPEFCFVLFSFLFWVLANTMHSPLSSLSPRFSAHRRLLSCRPTPPALGRPAMASCRGISTPE